MANKNIRQVFSENPEDDLWEELLQFSYQKNIETYQEENSISSSSNETIINCIVGSFLQANEYYKAARNANLQIEPLLLYYGSTNLLYGMTTLLNGEIPNIQNHGMKLNQPDEISQISDITLHFNNLKDGGIHVYAKGWGYSTELTNSGDWSLNKFLDSIAEIDEDYRRCYNVSCGKIAMLDVYDTPDEEVERVYFDDSNEEYIKDLFNDIENFKNSYLPIESVNNFEEKTEYYILRHKLGGKDISELSYSGQPYLRAGHKKQGYNITLPTIINMYVVLFALSSLCRYYPERWSPFVLNDISGEKFVIEKFLYYARRMIPNMVLNKIYGQEIQYVSSRYHSINKIKPVGEHQIQEIVQKEVSKDLDSNLFFQNNMWNKRTEV